MIVFYIYTIYIMMKYNLILTTFITTLIHVSKSLTNTDIRRLSKSFTRKLAPNIVRSRLRSCSIFLNPSEYYIGYNETDIAKPFAK